MKKFVVGLILCLMLLGGCNEALEGEPLTPEEKVVLTVNKDNYEIYVGDKIKLDYSVTPATTTVVVTCENPQMIDIEGDSITVLKEGTSTVTITAKDVSKEITINAIERKVNITAPEEMFSGIKADNSYFDYNLEITANFNLEAISLFLSDNMIVNNSDIIDNKLLLNFYIKNGNKIDIKIKRNELELEKSFDCIELNQKLNCKFFDINNNEINYLDKINLFLIDDNYKNNALENNILKELNFIVESQTDYSVEISGESVLLSNSNIEATKIGVGALIISSLDASGLKLEIPIKVFDTYATEIEFDNSQRNLEIGETIDLEVSALPNYSNNKLITFEADKDNIVIEGNSITALKSGESKVSIYLNGEKAGEIIVHVNEPKPPEKVYSLEFNPTKNIAIEDNILKVNLSASFVNVEFSVKLKIDNISTDEALTIKNINEDCILSYDYSFNNFKLTIISSGTIDITLTDGTRNYSFSILVK